MNIKSWFFFNVRLRIGRLERCYKCGRIIWNEKESLYDSLYYEGERRGKVKIGHLNCKKKGDRLPGGTGVGGDK